MIRDVTLAICTRQIGQIRRRVVLASSLSKCFANKLADSGYLFCVLGHWNYRILLHPDHEYFVIYISALVIVGHLAPAVVKFAINDNSLRVVVYSPLVPPAVK